MFYLGEFSFDGAVVGVDAAIDGPAHGRFSAMVDAGCVEAALRDLRRLVRRHTEREHGVLADATEIYLDALIKVSDMPKGGVLAYFEQRRGAFQGGLNVALPMHRGSCEAYREGNAEERENESIAREPFVKLAPGPKAVAKRKTRNITPNH